MRAHSRRRAWLCFCLASIALQPREVFAHVNPVDAPAFWAGALHVVVTPLAIAALLGLAAATARAAEGLQFRVALAVSVPAALIAAFAPLLLVQTAWALLAPLGPITLGLCAALGIAPRQRLALALAIVASVTIGLAAMPEPQSLLAASGVGAAVLIAMFWLLEALRRVDARWPIVRRVLGAWVAAFSLLVGALLYVTLFGR